MKDLDIQPRLFIILHQITFTCVSLFQLQLWNSAGFNHFFNHLDQNRNSPSYEKFSIFSLIVHLYYKQRKGFFTCWKSNLWKMRHISFTKMDLNKWGFISFILILFLFYFRLFFSIAQHAFRKDYLKMKKNNNFQNFLNLLLYDVHFSNGFSASDFLA